MASTQTTPYQLAQIRNDVSDVHRRIDEVTVKARDLDASNVADVVRRAEEAGAALARLEWALDRAVAD